MPIDIKIFEPLIKKLVEDPTRLESILKIILDALMPEVRIGKYELIVGVLKKVKVK